MMNAAGLLSEHRSRGEKETNFQVYSRSEEGQWLAGIWEGGRKVRS